MLHLYPSCLPSSLSPHIYNCFSLKFSSGFLLFLKKRMRTKFFSMLNEPLHGLVPACFFTFIPHPTLPYAFQLSHIHLLSVSLICYVFFYHRAFEFALNMFYPLEMSSPYLVNFYSLALRASMTSSEKPSLTSLIRWHLTLEVIISWSSLL